MSINRDRAARFFYDMQLPGQPSEEFEQLPSVRINYYYSLADRLIEFMSEAEHTTDARTVFDDVWDRR